MPLAVGQRGVRIAVGTAVMFCSGLLASGEKPDTGNAWPEVKVEPLAVELDPNVTLAEPLLFDQLNGVQRAEATALLEETSPLRQTSMLQPTPFLLPQTELPATPATPTAATSLTSLLEDEGFDRSVLRQAKRGVASLSNDLVRGAEATPMVSTDIGDLLGEAPGALSVRTQRRTPIVNDTRVRSERIGAFAASGSHWVPARADLDTAMSKIDSRLISDVIIVPGPYSSVYGPGFRFVDFELLKSPRFSQGREVHGQSSFDHQSNGNQWLAQQSFWGGTKNWGVRGSYSHRYANDYRAGDGSKVDASYESRAFAFALGRDLRNNTSIELSALRLDQTDVKFPGYVFDIDILVTNGYEVSHIDYDPDYADRVETEVWYNRTWFEGNSQDPAKRNQFPLLNRVNYVGFTDVESMSTGYRRARTWGEQLDCGQFTLGHDVRFIKQELNEIANATTLGLPLPITNRNSPIPRSFSVNPGLFLEYGEQFLEDWTFTTGARVDYIQTDIVADQSELQQVGLDFFPASYQEIVGTDQSQTDRVLWSLYGTLTRRHNDCLTTSASLGFAQRPPNLTELYAAQPFLLLLQNGLNNVTGDPTLKREKMIQADLSLDFASDPLRAGIRGFYAWGLDYMTFENTNIVRGPPNGDVQQVSLRYVNTRLATLVGFESFLELFPKRRLTPFANIRYVDGRDRTRNGDFATTNGSAGSPSTKVYGLPRGFFSGLVGSDSEPLPGISPLETRLGLRWTDSAEQPTWNLELSARIADDQDRVATSLLESPTPGFTVYDIRGTYRPRFASNSVFVAGVENFTDKAYREHLDFRNQSGIQILQPGISFYVGGDLSY